ncbi:unnamed protein product [Mytilus coruscus]|uniref:Uncharacterized protein n=1 Tax=Mytilus coruscus TaxID=42192 RepID=A0A6J8CTT0_MYTCO|nr:unnamed protein product [Mytilus coruscus]
MTTDFDTHQNSTNNNSSIIDKADISYDRIAGSFGFEKYNPPTLLTRHPPPATGRDDDIITLKEVLDDILIKTDKVGTNAAKSYRILFGADNKIGANLLKLMSMSSKYKIFIPEYPILHLKKSKINNICSGYKHAGIIQILKYMRDEEYNEWKKLISADHIEKASRYIRRLSIALRISFQVKFIQTLQQDQRKEVLSDLQQETNNWKKWELLYKDFLAKSRRENATFLLHYEMMEHCEEVSALSLAERLVVIRDII